MPVRDRIAGQDCSREAFLRPFGGGITVAMLPELGDTYGITAATASSSVTAFMLPCRSRR